MRFLAWLLIHTVYRAAQATASSNIPDEGPAVLVCNHVSFVDALVIAARVPPADPLRHGPPDLPRSRCSTSSSAPMRAIPIAPAQEDPALMERAFDEVAQALARGRARRHLPRGHASPTTGELNRVPARASSASSQRTPVPVVPMALRGLWGSFFSRKGGAAMRRPFRRFWSRIELVCGPPVPPDVATAEALQAAVLALRGRRGERMTILLWVPGRFPARKGEGASRAPCEPVAPLATFQVP